MSDAGGTPGAPIPDHPSDPPPLTSQPVEPQGTGAPLSQADFHWQAFFQRAQEPLFLLNRRRRILFVNRAWERLTGLLAPQARGLACTRARPAESGTWEAVLAHLLAPPPEVLQGRLSQTRRLIPGAAATRRWWDVEFLPLREGNSLLGILGRISPVLTEEASQNPPLPERLAGLREDVAQRYRIDHLAASLPAMRRVADQVRLAAQSCVPVLLRGERGTGKHWLARCIHHHGTTRERTFLALDCARLPGTGLTAILVGDGGVLRRSDFGTLYLREPACLPRELQAQLCDLLREASTGGAPTLRVIAGCTADPAELVQAGRLLEELRWALGTLVIELPPLRERRADLRDLVDRLLERINTAGDRSITGLTPDTWDLVHAYGWPGNLTELYAVLMSAGGRAKTERIGSADLPAYVRTAVHMEHTPGEGPERPLPLDKLLEQAERRLIQVALRRAQGNKSRAAEILAIWRPRLLRRMEALGIEGQAAESDGD